MLRVLHVVGGMNQGGTENFIMNLYRNINRNKIQFDFLVNRNGIFDDEIKNLGGKIYYIPALQKVGQLKYTKNLDNFFNEHKEYTIVHSHINQVSGLILERANKANIPIRIAHSHNNKYGKNIFIKLYKNYLATKIKDNANYKFACSKEAGRFLFGKNSNFQVFNNFIDTKKFIYNPDIRNKVRKMFNINNDCFVIGFVGRLCYQKNPLFLLQIFTEYLKLNKNSKLIMVGNGKLKDKVLSYIKNNNIKDNVILLENRNDINELLQAMDFFLLPSKYEGLGIVLIEAQASGLKCLTSKDVVSTEAQITDLLNFYSLQKSPHEWAKFIYTNKSYARKDMTTTMLKSGYDIKENIKNIENFYLNGEHL